MKIQVSLSFVHGSVTIFMDPKVVNVYDTATYVTQYAENAENAEKLFHCEIGFNNYSLSKSENFLPHFCRLQTKDKLYSLILSQ